MPASQAVLVDSSVWIDYLRRGTSRAARTLDRLLQEDLVCITALVRAELLSGAPDASAYELLSDRLSVLPLPTDPPGLWDRVAHARFRLARNGIQASLIDVSLVVTARYHRCALFTIDKDFLPIARILPLTLL